MQVEQTKMWKHIYSGQTTGWTHTLVGEARLLHKSLRLINVDWVVYSTFLDSNIQKKVIQENNYFMHRDHFILTKCRNDRSLC